MSRKTPIALSVLALVALAALGTFWAQTAALLRRTETALAEARNEARRAAEDRDRSAADLLAMERASLQRQTDLEAHKRELGDRILEFETQNGLLGDQLVEARARIEELSARAEGVERRRGQPMPIGIRRVLRDLDGLLDDEGRSDLRFLRVAKIEDRVLHEVELLQRAPDGLGTTVFTAARCEIVLERSVSRAEFRLYEGRSVGDEAGEIGDEKPRIVEVGEVDARTWEAVLPTVLTANGEYPVEIGPELVAANAFTRTDWRARFGRVFSMASGVEQWELARFQTEDSEGFRDVLLHGYEGETELLARAIDCKRAAFEIDSENGIVSLLLRDGWVRRKRGDTRIPTEGLRMPLPGVTPKQVFDEMLGHVRYR